MHRFPSISTLFLAILTIAAAPAAAQVASALLVEGGGLPGGPVGETVSSIGNSAVNHAGGYAFGINSTDGTETLSRIWGSADGGLGGLLFSEGTYGDYTQTSFESFFGIGNAGEAAYSPICNDNVGGGTGLDAVWLNDTVCMIEEAVYPPNPVYYWSFGSRPGCTADGRPYWEGGYTAVQGGSTQFRGLYLGTDATAVLESGDIIGGVDLAVTANGFDFDYRFSAMASHWISPLTLNTVTTGDLHMVMDGTALTAGGEFVVEGGVVPAAIGGLAGEHWAAFDFCGVTEDGHWFVTGDTDAAITVDEFVMVDGEIVLREGDLVDGYVVNGAIEGGYLNEDGDWAVIWDLDVDAVNVEALIVNGELVLREGDAVDWDGDGVVDSTAVLTDFTGISSLTLGNRDGEGALRAYFTADVNLPDARQPIQLQTMPLPLDVAGLEQALESPERGDRAVLEGGFVLPLSMATAVETAPGAGVLLAANYPNPFNPATKISFSLPRAMRVTVEILDAAGRHVDTLFAGELPEGGHALTWNGADGQGRAQASGLYLYRLCGDGWQRTRRMLLLK
ncbi:MAG: hypothetical protein H6694_09290 [Candidatus Latescibacteria bacterium]|nr:hypothetical protein [Candidatus Latescibacterota bacterium]